MKRSIPPMENASRQVFDLSLPSSKTVDTKTLIVDGLLVIKRL
jgi:hypothetical protein